MHFYGRGAPERIFAVHFYAAPIIILAYKIQDVYLYRDDDPQSFLQGRRGSGSKKDAQALCSTWRSPRCATPRATPLQHTLPLARCRPRRSAMDTRALASSSVGPRPNAAAPAQLACWPACRRRPPRVRARRCAPSRIAPAACDHPMRTGTSILLFAAGPGLLVALLAGIVSPASVRHSVRAAARRSSRCRSFPR